MGRKKRIAAKDKKEEFSIESYYREGFKFVHFVINANNPPEVKLAYDRMIKLGHTEESTIKAIIACYTIERNEELITKNPFNKKRFIASINNLPKFPSIDTVSNFLLN